jgi:hypothetical protein
VLAAKWSLGEAKAFKCLRPIGFLFHPAKLVRADCGIMMGFGGDGYQISDQTSHPAEIPSDPKSPWVRSSISA